MISECACCISKWEFNIKLLKYVVDDVVACWVRGCSSPLGQWARSIGPQQLTGNMKSAKKKRLPILEILFFIEGKLATVLQIG